MGGRVLAAPVLEKGATNRTVQLPRGYTWFQFNATATAPPGPAFTVDVEMTTIPVYIRAGTYAARRLFENSARAGSRWRWDRAFVFKLFFDVGPCVGRR